MNVLCIGNSFSEDATRYLHQISDGEIYVRNLYIGGCSLETHWNNIVEARADYEWQKNGRMLKMMSINDALTKKKWDFVTVQQVSQLSGMPETYDGLYATCRSDTAPVAGDEQSDSIHHSLFGIRRQDK